MSFATDWEPRDEVLTVRGRSYRWVEGGGAGREAERLKGRRGALPGLFHTAVLPAMERRGAVRAEHRAGRGVPRHRARWVCWKAPGESRVVWALFATPRLLGGREVPANDGAVLAAWGDGPLLAWAHDDSGVREAVRQALRELPEFLGEGLVSADATWPLRVALTRPCEPGARRYPGCAS